jgi:hypothetical protein
MDKNERKGFVVRTILPDGSVTQGEPITEKEAMKWALWSNEKYPDCRSTVIPSGGNGFPTTEQRRQRHRMTQQAGHRTDDSRSTIDHDIRSDWLESGDT